MPDTRYIKLRYRLQLSRLKSGEKGRRKTDFLGMAEGIQEVLGMELRQKLIDDVHREIAEIRDGKR